MLRVAVAGAGFMGETHAIRWAALPDVRVVAVYSRTAARAQALAERVGAEAVTDLDRLLQVPADVVDVCLPTDRHCTTALAAFAAGRQVVCEKPIALTVEDGQRMVDAARSAGRLLLVAHVVRFWPEYVRLREMVHQGAIGTPTSALALRLQEGPGPDPDPAPRRVVNGGPVVDLQIHDDDYLAWLLGTPHRVAACGRDRHVFTSLWFRQAAAVAEAAADLPKGFPFTSTIRVRGDAGVIEYVFRAGGARPDEPAGGIRALTLQVPGQATRTIDVPAGDPYALQLEHFAACLRAGTPSPAAPAQEAVTALRIALAARDALDHAGPVALD